MVAAYQAEDFAAMREAALRVLDIRPGYPGGLFNFAFAQILAGDLDGSLATMNELADMEVDVGADRVAEFADLRLHPRWPDYADRLVALRKPAGEAEVAFRVHGQHFVPEGIAFDADGRLLLGSIRFGRILRVGDEVEVLDDARTSDHWSVFGIRTDNAGGLWFASSAVPQFILADDDNANHAGLFRLNLESRKIDQRAELPFADTPQVLGDLVLADDDTIYTTDSLTGVLYRYSIADREYSTVVDRGTFASPQGLVLDKSGEHLFVADWVGGLYRVRLADGTVERVVSEDTVSTYGIDGLYCYGDELIAIQNGIRPHRVVALALSKDGLAITGHRTLARNLPEFDEPTLGAIVGDEFYFVANSHWNRFDKNNRLPDGLSGPIILRVSLERSSERD